MVGAKRLERDAPPEQRVLARDHLPHAAAAERAAEHVALVFDDAVLGRLRCDRCSAQARLRVRCRVGVVVDLDRGGARLVTRLVTRRRFRRNMIVLLRSVNDRTSLPEIRRCSEHPDLRVRLEAIKTLLALEPSVPRALLEQAIKDPDPKMA